MAAVIKYELPFASFKINFDPRSCAAFKEGVASWLERALCPPLSHVTV
jgi:hypothetical protein